MSNYDLIHENQVEIVELSDEAMEAVAGGDGGEEFEIEENYKNFSYNKIIDSIIVIQFGSSFSYTGKP